MGEEKVRVGAIEEYDGDLLVLLDLVKQPMELDDHDRVDQVDRRVVERDAPQRGGPGHGETSECG